MPLLHVLGCKIISPHIKSLTKVLFHVRSYSTSQSTAELFSKEDSLPEIRDKLRGLGQGSIDFVPDYQPGIGLITLNNPTRHNAMSGVMMSQLADLTDKLENEPADLAGLIVTGSVPAKAFCAGLDLSTAKEYLLTPVAGVAFGRLMHDTLSRFSRLPLISVASLAYPALGGGAEISTACDFRVLAPSSRIQFLQTRMAIAPAWGATNRLIRLIGRSKALKYLASSAPISPDVGYQIGLVDHVSQDSLDPYTQCLEDSAKMLASFFVLDSKGNRVSPRALQGIKKLVAHADLVNDDIEYDMEVLSKLWGSEENLKAVLGGGQKSKTTKKE
ncbi:ClpP/crotonase-like domain-containing protein [Umbelopsis sp. PMI_123]|nr:ClpP/crotonase-like domain-containing protein [Umbelopsis sp. PMI_123]